jgi:hypothetical protein
MLKENGYFNKESDSAPAEKQRPGHIPGLCFLCYKLCESPICGHRLLNLRRRHLRILNLRHHQKMDAIRHRLKDESLPVKGWMESFESFVRAVRHDSDSSAGRSDSEPRALNYLPATRSCFVFVASCCFVVDADKHFPDGRNIWKVVVKHSKDYSHWQFFQLLIRLSPVCYNYYRFRALHYLVLD